MAGNGLAGHADGPAEGAYLSDASGLALDPGKHVYFLEAGGSKVRRAGVSSGRVETVLDLAALGQPKAKGLVHLGGQLWVIYPKAMDAYGSWDKPVRHVKFPFEAKTATAFPGGMVLLDTKGRVYRTMLDAKAGEREPVFEPYVLGATARAIAVAGDKTVLLEGIDATKGLLQIEVFDAQAKSLDRRNASLVPAVAEQIEKAGTAALAGARYDDGAEEVYLYAPGTSYLKELNLQDTDPWYVFHDLALPFRGTAADPSFPFQNLGGLVVDPMRRTLYLSDLADFQLKWVKDYDFDADAFGTRTRTFSDDYAYPRTRLPGVQRILGFGTSYMMSFYGGGLKQDSLNKRIEHYLNLGSADGTAYELIFAGAPAREGVLVRARDSFEKLQDFDIDSILLTFNPYDIWMDMVNCMNNPQGLDGTPVSEPDPEEMLEDLPEKRAQRTAWMVQKEFKQNASYYAPDVVLNSSGRITYDERDSNIYRFFANPRFAALATQVSLDIAASMAKQAAKIFPGKPIAFVFYPTRNFLGKADVTPNTKFLSKMEVLATFDFGPMKAGLEALGIQVIDLQAACRFDALSYFPLFLWDGHLTAKGSDYLGYVTAARLRPLLGQARSATAAP